jgi:hypothetical protein
MVREYQDLACAGPENSPLCNAAIAFATAKHHALADQCLVGSQIIAHESGLPRNRLSLAQAEAIVAESRGNYAVAAAHAENLLVEFADSISNEVRSQIYGLLIACYQRLSRLDDLLVVKKKKLSLSESRYNSGLAAAMVVLDLKASLKSLSK